ncbi:hypothetical protein E4U43_000231 [Claviceps pusilla]|uniref:Uncharacterized protein n=1 Tax=Claviceps pusilla TaxID=123648 RepID=A0A9P7T084_9HYPO|nr:hypothetical protein E4U43_000231 [Claviceps pusilla]
MTRGHVLLRVTVLTSEERWQGQRQDDRGGAQPEAQQAGRSVLRDAQQPRERRHLHCRRHRGRPHSLAYTGSTCGQSWFLSQNQVGSNFQKPKCVWLEADHINKINARALTFHLSDKAPSTDRNRPVSEAARDALALQQHAALLLLGMMLPRGSNHNPEHLIITDHLDEDVRVVCEHTN